MLSRPIRWTGRPIAGLALGLILLALLCAPAATAHAEEFKTHFDLAVALYQAQRFEQAIPEFLAAYQIDPKPGLLFNIAQAYRKAGRPKEAIEYYDKYLASDPQMDADTKQKVDNYLAEAKNTLAALELELKKRMAEQKAAGHEEDRSTPQEPGPGARPAGAGAGAGAGTAAGVVAAPPAQPVYKRWWFWTAVAGGAVVIAGAVAGGVLGAQAAQGTPASARVDSGVPLATVYF